jgi:transposase InsO family protein
MMELGSVSRLEKAYNQKRLHSPLGYLPPGSRRAGG